MQNYELRQGAKKGQPWNAGREIGTKRALKPQQVWAIRFWLNHQRRVRDRAMFDLAIDSKLRGCDIVKIKIGDLISGCTVRPRAIIVQQKTSRPVQFELLEPAREAFWPGSSAVTARLRTLSFQVELTARIILALGNMRDWLTNGLPA